MFFPFLFKRPVIPGSERATDASSARPGTQCRIAAKRRKAGARILLLFLLRIPANAKRNLVCPVDFCHGLKTRLEQFSSGFRKNPLDKRRGGVEKNPTKLNQRGK
jgi:hypothetical protein